MFRLIKLAAYALIGFALYEIVQGMTQTGGTPRMRRTSRPHRDLERALNSDLGRAQTLTGPGIGTEVSTADSDGGSVTHSVGRGVVTR